MVFQKFKELGTAKAVVRYLQREHLPLPSRPLRGPAPHEVFWTLVKEVEAQLPEYECERHERPDRQRAVGGGRDFDQPVVIQVAQVLTYLRLPIPQETVAVLFGARQPDVSRDLRRGLPLICRWVPAPYEKAVQASCRSRS